MLPKFLVLLILSGLLAISTASAQTDFSYGDNIRGKVKTLGPIYFAKGPEIGAMAVFEMVGEIPTRDEQYLDRAALAACLALGARIVNEIRRAKDQAYTHIVIQFQWPASGIDPGTSLPIKTINWTGVFGVENCAALE